MIVKENFKLTTEQVTTNINDASLRSLRLAYNKKSSKKHKKWFDKDCGSLKQLNLFSNKKKT